MPVKFYSQLYNYCIFNGFSLSEEEKSEDEEEDEDDQGDKEILKTAEIYHAGAVNRVRVGYHLLSYPTTKLQAITWKCLIPR